MNRTLFLKSAPLLLAGSLALFSGSAAHAQISAQGGFTFTAPTSTVLTVTPGQTVAFSGTFQNITALEQLDSVTIGLDPNSNFGGKFTFSSPFFATLGVGQSQEFTGTLKVSSTATFSPTTFYLNANGTGDQSGSDYNFGSANFTIKLAPKTPAVPEASTTVTFGLLLAGLGLLVVRSRKRSAV